MKTTVRLAKVLLAALLLLAGAQASALAGPFITWNTFLGGSLDDSCNSITVDGSGNLYVTGSSNATWGTPVNPFGAATAYAFVAKFSADGALQWNTFLGGSSGYASGNSIKTDSSGNVFIVGKAEATWGAPLRPFSGVSDAFVAKLNASGALQWHTFLGGSNNDHGYGLTLDGSVNIYVTGHSESSWGSPVNAHTGGGFQDAFVARLDSSGTLTWNTFLGGASSDAGSSIAADGSGNLYATGSSFATWGTPVNPFTDALGANGFVAKLSATTGSRQWHTFVGGNIDKSAIDSSGNLYVTGYSTATWGSPVNAFASGGAMDMDGQVVKIDGSTGSVLWNTFFGSTDLDSGAGIAVDAGGNLYVSGRSDATWGSPLIAFGSGSCALVAKFAGSTGALQWNAFIGTADVGSAITLDASGNPYIAGFGSVSWGSPVNAFVGSGGRYDGFVARLAPPDAATTSTTTTAVATTTTTTADTTTTVVPDTTTIPPDTTTIPDTSTTSIPVDTSTTTTISRCPFRNLVQAEAESVGALRDRMLETAMGSSFATMYYQNMDEITAILKADETMAAQFSSIVKDNAAVISGLLQDGRADIKAAEMLRIIAFLKDLQKQASLKLQNDIDFVLRGIKTGWLLNWMGVAVE